MLANIDNFPGVRILGEKSPMDSDEDDNAKNNKTQAEHDKQNRAPTTREDLVALLSVLERPPGAIASEEAATAPLYDTFIHLYGPKIDRRRSSMQMLQSIVTNATSNTALAKSIKTVSLLILSREHQQPRLSHAATQMYSDALRCTRQQLVDPNLDKVTVIVIGHMLCLCELFFSKDLDYNGVKAHTRWVISLIESCCRDSSFPITHPLRSSPLRLFATWEALIVRRLPEGLQLPTGDLPVHAPGSMATLSDLSIMTADLIQRSDAFCMQNSSPYISQVLNFLNELVQIEVKLHKLMTSYYESTTGRHYRYTSPTVKSIRDTVPLFPYNYDFEDSEGATYHIGYWMCLLALADARIDISKTYGHILDVGSSEPFVREEKLAKEYANHICMSIPFMGRPSCGWSGRVVAIRPLRFLLQHFRKRGEWQKVGWCVQCAADLAV